MNKGALILKKNRVILNGLIIILSFSIIIIGLVSYMNRSEGDDLTTQDEEMPSGQDNVDETEGAEETPDLPMWYVDGEFELPITGAAGYTSVEQPLYEEPQKDASGTLTLKPGTPFEIREEAGDFWFVNTGNLEGWIEHRLAFVNLPDVIPSIIYDHTNSYDSRFQSSRIDIPELTGKPLNPMINYNERLQEEAFIMPILYPTAKKVFHAQQLALQNGDSLVVYETFRPRELQLLVNDSLKELAELNEEVEKGITEAPWSMTWFINVNVSNHQRGTAIDLSLADVEELTDRTIGDFKALKVESFTEYMMQTPIHELSAESAIFERPIASADREGWRELTINPNMTEPALRLQEYMVTAGFNPLASEWWHFNDVDAYEDLGVHAGTGEYLINDALNSAPLWENLKTQEE